MILNHKEAIRYLVQNIRSLTPTEETIRTVHYLLSDSLVPPGMAGQIRSDSIGVTGTTYASLVADLVRSLVPPAEVMGFIEARITDQVQPQHRDKFTQDVVAELNHLDISRMGGLGITREQLAAWLNLRSP